MAIARKSGRELIDGNSDDQLNWPLIEHAASICLALRGTNFDLWIRRPCVRKHTIEKPSLCHELDFGLGNNRLKMGGVRI